jgi:hypothetical protein
MTMNTKKLWWCALPLALATLVACAEDELDADGMAGSGGSSAGSPSKGGSAGEGGSATGEAGSGTGGDTAGPTPRGKDDPPALGAQIDRMGRPAINTALNMTFASDEDEKGMGKDAYNAAAPGDWADFTDEFAANLGILDALDATCGNQLLVGSGAERYQALAGVLIDDQLYVNTDKGECTEYLGVEAEALELVTDGSCGGRTPAYDVIERSYSVLAAGVLIGVDDTITEDDAEHDPDVFPFLAEPQ